MIGGVVWLNWVIGALIAFGVPGVLLWMTFRYPETAPDFSEARAYLEAKAAAERAALAAAGGVPAPRPAAEAPAAPVAPQHAA